MAQSIQWQRVARRIRVPLGFAFAAFYIWRAQPTWASLAVGGAVALLGVWIRAYASGYVNKNEELATTGPYAYTRNPLYLGSVVIGIGFVLAALDYWIALVMIVMYIAIYVPVIRGEEQYLSSKFADYKAYMMAVPRLFPRPTAAKIGSATRGAFSRELYMKHREYNALIGTLLVIVAVAAKRIWLAR